eukprot:TRINITY_DN33427_c0_g1_i1.p1 TRINITY_DN33427_c0_g1~~TRINITY_DN33427_c0_g1_i1.p1  ORF type:complete len:184 (+),score=38.06 TRINITY_DN33427_c0_g1_i1:74-625(+)
MALVSIDTKVSQEGGQPVSAQEPVVDQPNAGEEATVPADPKPPAASAKPSTDANLVCRMQDGTVLEMTPEEARAMICDLVSQRIRARQEEREAARANPSNAPPGAGGALFQNDGLFSLFREPDPDSRSSESSHRHYALNTINTADLPECSSDEDSSDIISESSHYSFASIPTTAASIEFLEGP